MSNNLRRQLEKAVVFIDQNLGKQLTTVDVANAACISNFHFQRVFSAYMGETLAQYILHRRLERAAMMLLKTKNMGITYIASQFGFTNHSAFSRAFKKQFKVSPSEFRRSPNQAVLSDNKLNPYLKTGAAKNKTMGVSVEELPSLWFNYRRARTMMTSHDRKDNFLQITQETRYGLSLKEPNCLGLATSCSSTYSAKPQQSNESYESLVYGGLYKSQPSDEWSDESFEIEAGLWAVCSHDGANEYTYQTWNNLIRSWLPESSYELRDTIHFGLYFGAVEKGAKQDKLRKKLYLPIKVS